MVKLTGGRSKTVDQKKKAVQCLIIWNILKSLNILSCAVAANSLQLCPTLCNPIDGSYQTPPPWDSPGKNTGVGCHFLLLCSIVFCYAIRMYNTEVVLGKVSLNCF